MNDRLHPDIIEATRLTRAGRLGEATALLQRLLGGAHQSEPAPNTASDAIGRTTDGPTERESAVPEALRGFLRRVGRIGSGTRAAGRAMPSPAWQPDIPPADIVPDRGRFVAGSYANQAGSRAYKLYIPSGYRGQAVPLVVMLHGCTQSPDDFAAGTRMNALAEELTCLVVYPAQAASANSSKCWNWFRPGDQQRGEGEPSLVAGITRQIMEDYAVNPQRVYVAGLSAGAATAVTMGMTYPDLYAAVGVHSGLASGAASDVPSAFAAMRQGTAAGSRSGGAFHANGRRAGERRESVPTIVFHGDRDKTVHPRNGDHVIAQAREGMATDLQTRVEQGRVPDGHGYSRTVHADTQGRTILEHWVIHGAGHAWSGGSAAGSYTDPRGPDAAREMLRFFLERK